MNECRYGRAIALLQEHEGRLSEQREAIAKLVSFLHLVCPSVLTCSAELRRPLLPCILTSMLMHALVTSPRMYVFLYICKYVSISSSQLARNDKTSVLSCCWRALHATLHMSSVAHRPSHTCFHVHDIWFDLLQQGQLADCEAATKECETSANYLAVSIQGMLGRCVADHVPCKSMPMLHASCVTCDLLPSSLNCVHPLCVVAPTVA
jgi:hypothetical protein